VTPLNVQEVLDRVKTPSPEVREHELLFTYVPPEKNPHRPEFYVPRIARRLVNYLQST
jgi:hypothetical protein